MYDKTYPLDDFTVKNRVLILKTKIYINTAHSLSRYPFRTKNLKNFKIYIFKNSKNQNKFIIKGKNGGYHT